MQTNEMKNAVAVTRANCGLMSGVFRRSLSCCVPGCFLRYTKAERTQTDNTISNTRYPPVSDPKTSNHRKSKRDVIPKPRPVARITLSSRYVRERISVGQKNRVQKE